MDDHTKKNGVNVSTIKKTADGTARKNRTSCTAGTTKNGKHRCSGRKEREEPDISGGDGNKERFGALGLSEGEHIVVQHSDDTKQNCGAGGDCGGRYCTREEHGEDKSRGESGNVGTSCVVHENSKIDKTGNHRYETYVYNTADKASGDAVVVLGQDSDEYGNDCAISTAGTTRKPYLAEKVPPADNKMLNLRMLSENFMLLLREIRCFEDVRNAISASRLTEDAFVHIKLPSFLEFAHTSLLAWYDRYLSASEKEGDMISASAIFEQCVLIFNSSKRDSEHIICEELKYYSVELDNNTKLLEDAERAQIKISGELLSATNAARKMLKNYTYAHKLFCHIKDCSRNNEHGNVPKDISTDQHEKPRIPHTLETGIDSNTRDENESTRAAVADVPLDTCSGTDYCVFEMNILKVATNALFILKMLESCEDAAKMRQSVLLCSSASEREQRSTTLGSCADGSVSASEILSSSARVETNACAMAQSVVFDNSTSEYADNGASRRNVHADDTSTNQGDLLVRYRTFYDEKLSNDVSLAFSLVDALKGTKKNWLLVARSCRVIISIIEQVKEDKRSRVDPQKRGERAEQYVEEDQLATFSHTSIDARMESACCDALDKYNASISNERVENKKRRASVEERRHVVQYLSDMCAKLREMKQSLDRFGVTAKYLIRWSADIINDVNVANASEILKKRLPAKSDVSDTRSTDENMCIDTRQDKREHVMLECHGGEVRSDPGLIYNSARAAADVEIGASGTDMRECDGERSVLKTQVTDVYPVSDKSVAVTRDSAQFVTQSAGSSDILSQFADSGVGSYFFGLDPYLVKLAGDSALSTSVQASSSTPCVPGVDTQEGSVTIDQLNFDNTPTELLNMFAFLGQSGTMDHQHQQQHQTYQNYAFHNNNSGSRTSFSSAHPVVSDEDANKTWAPCKDNALGVNGTHTSTYANGEHDPHGAIAQQQQNRHDVTPDTSKLVKKEQMCEEYLNTGGAESRSSVVRVSKKRKQSQQQRGSKSKISKKTNAYEASASSNLNTTAVNGRSSASRRKSKHTQAYSSAPEDIHKVDEITKPSGSDKNRKRKSVSSSSAGSAGTTKVPKTESTGVKKRRTTTTSAAIARKKENDVPEGGHERSRSLTSRSSRHVDNKRYTSGDRLKKGAGSEEYEDVAYGGGSEDVYKGVDCGELGNRGADAETKSETGRIRMGDSSLEVGSGLETKRRLTAETSCNGTRTKQATSFAGNNKRFMGLLIEKEIHGYDIFGNLCIYCGMFVGTQAEQAKLLTYGPCAHYVCSCVCFSCGKPRYHKSSPCNCPYGFFDSEIVMQIKRRGSTTPSRKAVVNKTSGKRSTDSNRSDTAKDDDDFDKRKASQTLSSSGVVVKEEATLAANVSSCVANKGDLYSSSQSATPQKQQRRVADASQPEVLGGPECASLISYVSLRPESLGTDKLINITGVLYYLCAIFKAVYSKCEQAASSSSLVIREKEELPPERKGSDAEETGDDSAELDDDHIKLETPKNNRGSHVSVSGTSVRRANRKRTLENNVHNGKRMGSIGHTEREFDRDEEEEGEYGSYEWDEGGSYTSDDSDEDESDGGEGEEIRDRKKKKKKNARAKDRKKTSRTNRSHNGRIITGANESARSANGTAFVDTSDFPVVKSERREGGPMSTNSRSSSTNCATEIIRHSSSGSVSSQYSAEMSVCANFLENPSSCVFCGKDTTNCKNAVRELCCAPCLHSIKGSKKNRDSFAKTFAKAAGMFRNMYKEKFTVSDRVKDYICFELSFVDAFQETRRVVDKIRSGKLQFKARARSSSRPNQTPVINLTPEIAIAAQSHATSTGSNKSILSNNNGGRSAAARGGSGTNNAYTEYDADAAAECIRDDFRLSSPFDAQADEQYADAESTQDFPPDGDIPEATERSHDGSVVVAGEGLTLIDRDEGGNENEELNSRYTTLNADPVQQHAYNRQTVPRPKTTHQLDKRNRGLSPGLRVGFPSRSFVARPGNSKPNEN